MVKIEVDLAKKLDNIYSEISSVKSDISDVKVWTSFRIQSHERES